MCKDNASDPTVDEFNRGHASGISIERRRCVRIVRELTAKGPTSKRTRAWNEALKAAVEAIQNDT